jgi:hypothetical protein
MFWDRETKRALALKHTQLIPDQAPMSLAVLPDRKLLVGTTIEPGTGGAVKAKVAELFIMDIDSKQIEWHEPVLPNVHDYIDMCVGPQGLVFGFADRKRFLVFDPKTRKILAEKNIEPELGPTNIGQQIRTFVSAPDGAIYLLLIKGIAKLDQRTFAITMLAPSPVPIHAGGDYLEGRSYVASGSHMYSWAVPK